MSSSNRYKRLGINSIYTFIGNVGPQFISFLLVPFYTYWLSQEDFGIQDIILTYMGFAVPYVSLGLYESIFLFPKDRSLDEQRKYFSSAINVVIFSLLFLLVIWLLLPVSLHQAILPGKLGGYEFYMIMLIIASSFQRLIQGFARSLDKMSVYSITGIIYAIIVLILSLSLVPHYGIKGYFISFLTATIMSSIYTFLGLKGWLYYRIRSTRKDYISVMLKYSLPMVPNATMWWVVNSINRPIMLSSMGIEQVGIYALAGKFPSIINTLFSVFFYALQISVIEEFHKSNYSSFYNNVFRIIYMSLIGIVFFFMLFGDLLFRILVDEKFYSAVYYVPIISLGALIVSISTYVGITFTAIKKSVYFLYSSVIAAIVAVIANYLLIPRYGIMGACMAICLSQLSMLLYRWYKSVKYVNFEKKVRLSLITTFFILALFSYYCIENVVFKQVIIVGLLLAICLCNMDMVNSVRQVYIMRKINKKK